MRPGRELTVMYCITKDLLNLYSFNHWIFAYFIHICRSQVVRWSLQNCSELQLFSVGGERLLIRLITSTCLLTRLIANFSGLCVRGHELLSGCGCTGLKLSLMQCSNWLCESSWNCRWVGLMAGHRFLDCAVVLLSLLDIVLGMLGNCLQFIAWSKCRCRIRDLQRLFFCFCFCSVAFDRSRVLAKMCCGLDFAWPCSAARTDF